MHQKLYNLFSAQIPPTVDYQLLRKESIFVDNAMVVVALDGVESRVQSSRFSDVNRLFYSGKKGYTTATKLVACTMYGRIVFVGKSYPGSLNDITLAKFPDIHRFLMSLEKQAFITVDDGFRGIEKTWEFLQNRVIFASRLPQGFKDDGQNHIRGGRIIIENVFAQLKKWSSCSSVFKWYKKDEVDALEQHHQLWFYFWNNIYVEIFKKLPGNILGRTRDGDRWKNSNNSKNSKYVAYDIYSSLGGELDMERAHVYPLLEPTQKLQPVEPAYAHPVERIQKSWAQNQEELKYMALANVFGTHMVVRLEMEKKLLSSFTRLPVLKSEMAGLETVLQRDLEIGFEDIFPDQYTSEIGRTDVHAMMEEKLGMSIKRPIL